MTHIHKVLVVDDSIATGKAVKKCRELLKDIEHLYNIKYCAIYAVPLHTHSVDYFFEIVDYPRFFQWNIMNHSILQKTCMDIDGVLCADPTPEENDDGEKYRHFLLNALPLIHSQSHHWHTGHFTLGEIPSGDGSLAPEEPCEIQ